MRRAAVGVQFGREGPADRLLRIEAEEAEEGGIAVGQAAVRRAAEDGVALRIDETLVAHFAFMQPRVDGRDRAQRLLELFGKKIEFGGLQFERALAAAAGDQAREQDGEADKGNGAEQEGREQRQRAMQVDIERGGTAQGHRPEPEHGHASARERHPHPS